MNFIKNSCFYKHLGTARSLSSTWSLKCAFLTPFCSLFLCDILPNAFSAHTEMILYLSSFILMIYNAYWFTYVEVSLNLWYKSHLIIVHGLFDILLCSVYSLLLSIIACILSGIYLYKFLLFCIVHILLILISLKFLWAREKIQKLRALVSSSTQCLKHL